MQSNRINGLFRDPSSGNSSLMKSPAENATAPGSTASTQQVYEAAWSMAKRDWELNRLFNAWYYEI